MEILPFKVDEGVEFKKNIKEIKKKYRSVKEDIKPLVQQLEAGETPGDRMSGNKYPVFKTRVKNSDNKKGKSGGYRVIYYTKTPTAILLTTIYSKSERDNISNKEVEDIIDRSELEVEQQEKEIVIIDRDDSKDEEFDR
jgi:mRNA-degrading endonuclease RelE of RelBE toxin-antitoxin system